MSTTTAVENETRFEEGTVIHTKADGSLVNWSAVFAGAVLAIAISALLTTFGNAIGLTMTGPFAENGLSMETIGFTALLWFALVHIYAVGMGAYMAGRMRPRVQVTDRGEIQFRDGMNGLLVWAVAVIATLMMLAQVVGTALSGTGNLISSGGSAIGSAMTMSTRLAPEFDGLLNSVMTPTEPASTTDAGDGDGANQAAPANQTAASRAADAATTAANLSAADREAIMRAVQVRLMDGAVTESEIDELAQIISRRTSIDAAAAKDRLQTAATATAETVKKTTEAARHYTALAGFWTTFILLLSGLAAWWSGAVGGVHRDTV